MSFAVGAVAQSVLAVRESGYSDLYDFLPSKEANLAALIMFAVLWVYHTVVGLWYRQWWFLISWFIGFGLEVAGYVGRYESHDNPESMNDYLVQIVCLTLGPAFLMGGVYYQLAKIATVYSAELSPLRPMHYSALFITLDLISILVQAAGGGMAAGNDGDGAKLGTHIMVAGISFQVFSMLVFALMSSIFAWKIYKVAKGPGGKVDLVNNSRFNPDYVYLRSRKIFRVYFPIAIAWCTLGIFIRCVYRVAELAQGWNGFLITHEPYFLVLDGLMVFLGTLGLSVIHPGFVFGREVLPVKGLHKRANQTYRKDLESGHVNLLSNTKR